MLLLLGYSSAACTESEEDCPANYEGEETGFAQIRAHAAQSHQMKSAPTSCLQSQRCLSDEQAIAALEKAMSLLNLAQRAPLSPTQSHTTHSPTQSPSQSSTQCPTNSPSFSPTQSPTLSQHNPDRHFREYI